MASFRSAKSQAQRAVAKAIKLGQAKHGKEDDQKSVHSVGSARDYEQSLKQCAQWLIDNGIKNGLNKITEEQAISYLSERSDEVGQKVLDRDRVALQIVLQKDLDRIKSSVINITGPRSYTPNQIKEIINTQDYPNALSTSVAYAAGLRAHELLTIRPLAEQPASTHRKWSDGRFTGRNDGYVSYSVTGKGGLTREVRLPESLAQRLEQRRLDVPRDVVDRKIKQQQHYDIPAGQTWSNAFSRASNAALEYSTGAHGIRHTYAQERMEELQSRGHSYDDALKFVSEELGHFRPDVTLVYLR